jgi:diaminohydroxyphosphoribosylaminopyrimidine deaminase/5-amino-6-(5-phosphoribosylamino)uracil reductase
MDTNDDQYHLRCIQLAYNGLGRVAPNPLVGAVLLANNRIIGEGFHHFFGDSHAEVNAVNAVKDKSLLPQSTLLVNLEPCSHMGKTPPCTNLIIEKGIKKVVIGDIDPFPQVSGRGIKMLQNSNVEVSIGLETSLSRFLNRRFITFQEKKRPYIILKWAESFDGYIDRIRNINEPPAWITDNFARTIVHKWRTEEQAIMVGTNTALFDNPGLTSRLYYGKNPIRLIPDRNLRLPSDLKIFDKQAPTVVFTQKNFSKDSNSDNLKFVNISFDNFLDEVMQYCYQQGIQSIIVEGGNQLLSSFIEQNLWDEARVFRGEVFFEKGVVAPMLNEQPFCIRHMNNWSLLFYFNDDWVSIANLEYL